MWYEIWPDEYTGGVQVKSFTPDGYPSHSVLAGQTLIKFVGRFDTAEEALAKYPDAKFGNKMVSYQNHFDHLSDQQDLV